MELFEDLGAALNPHPEKELKIDSDQKPEVIMIRVKKWKNTDKYPCPKCSKKVAMPDYTCTDCNIKVKPVMNF